MAPLAEQEHLSQAAGSLEAAERQIASTLGDRHDDPVPDVDHHLGDELPTALARILDHAHTILGIASSLHVYEHELSNEEKDDARDSEPLVASAFETFGNPRQACKSWIAAWVDDREPFIWGAYVSARSLARRVRAFVDSDDHENHAVEIAHLREAAPLLEKAEREVAALLTAERRASLPEYGYGTYIDGDEIGAVLMRVKDYTEVIGQTAATRQTHQQELTGRERELVFSTEELLAETVLLYG